MHKSATGRNTKEKVERNLDIYWMFKAGKGARELAKEYNISNKRIYQILKQVERRYK